MNYEGFKPGDFISLSKEKQVFYFSTSHIEGYRAEIILNDSISSDPTIILVENDTLNIVVNGESILFTFKQFPDNSGTQLPYTNGLTAFPSTYVPLLMEYLRYNERLMSFFTIETGSYNFPYSKITLRSKTFDKISLAASCSSPSLTIGIYRSDWEPYKLKNMSARVKLFTSKGSELADLSGDLAFKERYGFSCYGLAQFDLRGFLNLKTHLPIPKDFEKLPIQYLDIPQSEWNNTTVLRVAWAAFGRFFCRYALKSGVPAKTSALLRGNAFVAVHGGGTPKSKDFLPNIENVYVCHPLPTMRISKKQPAWLHFIADNSTENVNVQAWFVDQNGGSIGVDYGGTKGFRRGHIYYLPVNWAAFQIERLIKEGVIPNFTPVAIDIKINKSVNSTYIEYLSYRIEYVDCGKEEAYLAFGNGFGGLDTIALESVVESVEADRQMAQENEPVDFFKKFDTRRGNTIETQTESNRVFAMKTRLLNKAEAATYRQLMTGETWILYPNSTDFRRIIVDSKSIKTTPEIGEYISFSFTAKDAWRSENAL